MKKIIFLVLLALSIVFAHAQKSSVKLQIGYGIPLAGSSFMPNTTQNGSTLTASNVSGSFGSGLIAEVGYTYSFAPLISAQVDFTYLIGKEYTSTSASGVYLVKDSYSGNFVQMAPLIRFDVGEGKLHPYAAVGPVFGFGSMKYKHFEDNDGGTTDEETKFDGSVSIGTKSVLGVELTKGNMGFFFQATMVSMSYSPSKSELTKHVVDGTDDLASVPTNQKITEYKDSFTTSGFDPSQPNQQTPIYYPLSSLSFSLGARLKF